MQNAIVTGSCRLSKESLIPGILQQGQNPYRQPERAMQEAVRLKPWRTKEV
jgi:hypothetical protein